MVIAQAGAHVGGTVQELSARVLDRLSANPSGRWSWLCGLALNLGLSLLYLIVAPLTSDSHQDLAILVGTYFALFLLADVTTTNALGADAERVRDRLNRGVPVRRILLRKNLALLLAVGAPILVATALITLQTDTPDRLALTLPAVLVPILIWLGVGNAVSVAFPVAAAPLRQRWQQRRDLRTTGRWLLALAIPYLLCLAVDPMTRLPMLIMRALGPYGHLSVAVPAVVLTGCGLAMYAAATAAGLRVSRRRVLARSMAAIAV